MWRYHRLRMIMAFVAMYFVGTLNIGNFISPTPVSALSYQSSIGLNFTFNPTLSISMSSNDLVIPDLIAGTSDNSNSLNVVVATNTLAGYTVSANTDNLAMVNNASSDHSFSSIEDNTYTDLTDFNTNAEDNTWGYSYSLDNGSSWSNYTGFINTNPTTNTVSDSDVLYDTTTPADNKTLGFKIAAKASSNQPSGVYTTTINFMAVSKVTPMSLADSYRQAGKTMVNGYYTMQDMTTEICNDTDIFDEQLQVIDIRDNNVYWIAKLHTDKDNPNIGQCWMTQNLDLNLETTPDRVTALTSENTDLTLYGDKGYTSANGYSCSNPTDPEATLTADCSGEDEVITWAPENNTISENLSSNWQDNYDYLYSYDIGKTAPGNDSKYGHAYVGNYYNWAAATASNNASSYISSVASNSICPAGWRLPDVAARQNSGYEYSKLLYAYDVTKNATNGIGYADSNPQGLSRITSNPLFFVRAGYIASGSLIDYNGGGYYWSSAVSSSKAAAYLYFYGTNVYPAYNNSKSVGRSVRCLAR